jgi:hypothetical protein
MTRAATALWLAALTAAATACSGSPTPPPAAAPPRPVTQATPPAPAGQAAAPAPGAIPAAAPAPAAPSTTVRADAPRTPPVPVYEARGRRDPFEPVQIVKGSRGPNVASAKLTGIVRGSGTHWALVETSDGIGYMLRPGDELGEGRVVEIQRDSVVFTIAPKPGAGPERVVLSLATQ